MKTVPIKKIRPTKKQERIHFLDILRGISILFIFLANILHFSGYSFLPTETKEAFETRSLDIFLDAFGYTLIDGKFYSIFSLLFGIGFTIQYRKVKKRGKPFAPFFLRRMAGLLLIGLFHIFIFLGDILTLYAIVGCMLIPFKNVSSRKLLQWAGVLLLLPVLHLYLINVTDSPYPYHFYGMVENYWKAAEFPMKTIPGGGTFADLEYIFKTRSWHDFLTISSFAPLQRIGTLLMEGRIFKVLALFILGIWAGRKILDENLLENIPFLKKVVFWGILIGLPMNIIRTCIEFEYLEVESPNLIAAIVYALGVAPMACAFSALLTLWYGQRKKMLRWFTPVGRMALTNYVVQTLIATLLYFGIGFGLYGKWGLSVTFLIAILIFALQVIFSAWWLKHFKYGPLEWLWRLLTYGRRIAN